VFSSNPTLMPTDQVSGPYARMLESLYATSNETLHVLPLSHASTCRIAMITSEDRGKRSDKTVTTRGKLRVLDISASPTALSILSLIIHVLCSKITWVGEQLSTVVPATEALPCISFQGSTSGTQKRPLSPALFSATVAAFNCAA
jgi:hypothetical protein